MNTISTLNSNELMATNDQLDSNLFMTENHDVSFGDTLNCVKEPIGVNLTSSLLEGALFIVSNGTYQTKNIPSHWQHAVDLLTQTFDSVISLNDYSHFFHGLIKAYVDLYNIDLHLIVYVNDKYILIDKSQFFESNEEVYKRENHAFIVCNIDNTTYSPLFINDVNGHKRTVFGTDEVFVWRYVKSFIDQVNRELVSTTQNHTESQQNVPEDDLSHMVVDETLSTTNHSISAILPPETTLQGDATIELLLHQTHQLVNILKPRLNQIPLGNQVSDFNLENLDQMSTQELASVLQHRLLCISNIVQSVAEQIPQDNNNTIPSNIVVESNSQPCNTVQSNESNHGVQTSQNFTNVQPAAPIHLLNTTQVSQTASTVTLIHAQYDAPEILIEPKTAWHYRSMKDLASRKMPLLAGEGPQRTLVRVKVPRTSDQQMYLGVKIQTHDDRDHRLKIPVPENTGVNLASFSNNNDLNRLQFHRCNQMDYFDPVTKYVYLAISSTEHDTEEKNVRIHMFNLYQSGSINRSTVDTEQLGKCKLAFWLCIREGGTYRSISDLSSSCLIEET